MHGNIREWVHDTWEAASYREREQKIVINPFETLQASPERVLRGGDWS